ncbi:MAG: HEAT repeat domain-containing protein [Treponema sp.]|jgi:HEAT repeat protein|nr:HEAT repeat domain-containing protein [Treponema sp.]
MKKTTIKKSKSAFPKLRFLGKHPVVVLFAFCAVFSVYSQESETAEKPVPAAEDQRLTIIRYGTDTEIANLIKTLRAEQTGPESRDVLSEVNSAEPPEELPEEMSPEDPIDRELAVLAGKTKNKNILTGVFSFFADRKKEGLEERAVRAIEERDDEAFETVSAAIDYMGRIESPLASEILMEILNGEESRFMNASIRALGKIAKNAGPEKTAEFLVDYYTNREPGDENRREIIIALGSTGSKKGTPFLASIAENNDERVPLRMSALEGLSAIGDEEGLPAVLAAAASGDPNVRAAAIAALGPFAGETADTAILEAFRDSYYRTRIAAAQASRDRKLEEAVPYLKFRCENDEVPNVRDEAVKALGAIGNTEARGILESLFTERKNSDRIRVGSAEMLLKNDAPDYVKKVIDEMDYAKSKNQTALYNGFLRVLGSAKAGDLEDLAKRFFSLGGVIEKSYALDMCLNNGFRGLTEQIRALSDPRNGSLAVKSNNILKKWETAGGEKSNGE